MKIIVIGATGTIGAAVASALAAKKHEVVRASRNGEVKVDIDEPRPVRGGQERRRGRLLRRQCGVQAVRAINRRRLRALLAQQADGPGHGRALRRGTPQR